MYPGYPEPGYTISRLPHGAARGKIKVPRRRDLPAIIRSPIKHHFTWKDIITFQQDRIGLYYFESDMKKKHSILFPFLSMFNYFYLTKRPSLLVNNIEVYNLHKNSVPKFIFEESLKKLFLFMTEIFFKAKIFHYWW